MCGRNVQEDAGSDWAAISGRIDTRETPRRPPTSTSWASEAGTRTSTTWTPSRVQIGRRRRQRSAASPTSTSSSPRAPSADHRRRGGGGTPAGKRAAGRKSRERARTLSATPGGGGGVERGTTGPVGGGNSATSLRRSTRRSGAAAASLAAAGCWRRSWGRQSTEAACWYLWDMSKTEQNEPLNTRSIPWTMDQTVVSHSVELGRHIVTNA